jgi:mRNA interferase RelE/StbE
MDLIFDRSFLQDLQKLSDPKIKQRVSATLALIEQARTLREIPNIIKMSGHNAAYRIRIGEYRIGLFRDKNVLKLIRFMHRKDIYSNFP